ncbi:hypothetical protein ES703_35500 [subsurface metagenome]
MKVSIDNIERVTDLKYSLGFQGDVLKESIYEDDLWHRKRKSVLRSIKSREDKASGNRFIARHKAKNQFKRKITRKVDEKRWPGYLSEFEDLKRYRYMTCGKYGVMERNKAGEQRYLVFNCNHIRTCPECSERYFNGRSYKREAMTAALMQANNNVKVRKFRLTFPDFLWERIRGNEERKLFKALGNKVLQELYGCTINKHGRYENGSVGIYIQWHQRSTQECWRDKPHMHCHVITLRLNGQEAEGVDVYRDERDLEQLQFKWAQAVKQLCLDLGWQEAEKIPDRLVVDEKYISENKNSKQKGALGFRFRYDQRSPVHDLQEAIVGIDNNNEVLLMHFKRGDLGYFSKWSFDEYIDEMFTLLNLKNLGSSYGWLRRLEKNADALGVEIKKEKDDFDPVQELSVKTKYRREYKAEFDKKRRRTKIVKHLYVKILTDPEDPVFWKEVEPWSIHGEEIWTGSKIKYLYGSARGRDPPDRGG